MGQGNTGHMLTLAYLLLADIGATFQGIWFESKHAVIFKITRHDLWCILPLPDNEFSGEFESVFFFLIIIWDKAQSYLRALWNQKAIIFLH